MKLNNIFLASKHILKAANEMQVLTRKFISHEFCEMEYSVLTSYRSSIPIQRETSPRVRGSLSCSSKCTASSTNLVPQLAAPTPISNLATAMTCPAICLYTCNAVILPMAIRTVVLNICSMHSSAGSWSSPLSLCSPSRGKATFNG